MQRLHRPVLESPSMNYARPEPLASRPLAEEQDLAPTAAPICPFLGWPVVTDPRLWTAQAAVLGIQHSEPYAGDPRPNDQARAPDAVRLVSAQISYGPEQWDFDLNAPLSALAPAHCVDAGNIAWVEGSYDAYASAATARLRHLWRSGAQVFVIGSPLPADCVMTRWRRSCARWRSGIASSGWTWSRSPPASTVRTPSRASWRGGSSSMSWEALGVQEARITNGGTRPAANC